MVASQDIHSKYLLNNVWNTTANPSYAWLLLTPIVALRDNQKVEKSKVLGRFRVSRLGLEKR